MKLRYYAPAYDAHEEIINLLNEIKQKNGLDYEVFEIRRKRSSYGLGAYPDPQHQKEIYEKDFKPRARTLKPRIGESVARALRSRRGRGGYFIAGTIALIEKNKVEWFSSYSDPLYEVWKSYDEKHPRTLGFLKMILERGVEPLKEILHRGAESEHDKLIKEFVSSGLLPGKFEEEVPVGEAMIIVDKYGVEKKVGRKTIDLVCKTSTENWVIEVEPELNATSLGQVLIYGDLCSRISSLPVKRGIVCRHAEEELMEICKKYVDRIFVLGKVWKKGKVNWSK
jgi:hypothetical protein